LTAIDNVIESNYIIFRIVGQFVNPKMWILPKLFM